MTGVSLTAQRHGATYTAMLWLGNGRKAAMRGGWSCVAICMLGGCINVAVPNEPIVIELNINIRSEVIYQLAEDTAETIEENADIF